MKNFRRNLLLLIVAGFSLAGMAQNSVDDKMSGATHFFIKDRDAKTVSKPTIKLKDLTPDANLSAPEFIGKRIQPLYAKPDTINGKAYISSFVRLDNENNTSAIEAKGAIVQCKFSNGLVTALIPVDSIESVAAIAQVKKVSVGRRMSMMGNKARQATNVDDVLTQSTDAISAGLSNKYDGSGVVLGVIDTGIDFNHIAFKDASGNSRIKTAYVYDGSSAKEYSGSSITSSLTDDSTEDHGTHTSSTAGGSSVIFSGTEGSSSWGSTVTVTTDHANATFGGMAPGADLYLAGVNGLSDTYLANSFQKIVNYADGQGKPVVVSNSWGASVGPRDGTGDIADVVNTYFGDSYPNHICLFAASNDAGNGGMYISGSASSSSPLGTVIKSNYNNYFVGVIADAWTRTSSSATMMCKIMTINKSTGAIVNTYTVTPTTNGASTGISGLYAIKETSSSGHAGCYLYAYGSGNGYITSSYYIAVQFYPSSGSATVDVWSPGGYTYFDNSPSISGYTWQLGTDDSSVSDEATIKNAIAIGAYVTKNSLYDHNGTSRSLTSSYPNVGDIAYFSSYQVEGKGATQELLPWITAPGATIVAGVNHNHTSGSYSYMNDNMAEYNMYRVNSNTSNPYGSMEGTSMATPCAAGIVALWLQAAQEVGKDLTVNDIKEIMKETAINDSYTTTGANASHFGNGKIDALAGIKYILGATSEPTIKAEPAEVNFTGYVCDTYTQKVSVKGLNLEAGITATISGDSSYSIDKSSITQSAAASGTDITVTWKPTAKGNTSAVLTLKSNAAEDVTVNVSGSVLSPDVIVDATNNTVNMTAEAGLTSTSTIGVLGSDLKDAVTLTLNDANSVFSLSATTVSKADAEEGKDVSVTFSPTTIGSYTATVTVTSPGAESVVVNLNGTATAPVPTLTASETELSFSADLSTEQTKTFVVSGHALTQDVTLTLADPNKVFTVTPATIAASDITADGVEVTVAFNSSKEGTFTGTLTLASEGAETITINLSGEATDGGTASDPYLNIAKYATIDDAGWSTTYVNTLYKYTEYTDEEVGWLTLPVYGAWTSCNFSPKAQKWINANFTSNNNTYAGTTWSSSDVLLGSSPYFTKTSNVGSPRAIGYNSRTNYTQEVVYFYVTNTTAVKLLGLGQSRSSSTYPASLKIYECTKAADGTLTDGTTAVKSYTNSATSGTFVLSATDLDASKIYKVEAATYRSYIAEIAFCTPLKKASVVGDVTRDGKVDISDVTATIDIVLGKDSTEPYVYDHVAADMNQDGTIDISDVTSLIDFVLGKTE